MLKLMTYIRAIVFGIFALVLTVCDISIFQIVDPENVGDFMRYNIHNNVTGRQISASINVITMHFLHYPSLFP